MPQLSGQRLPQITVAAPARKGDVHVVPFAAAAASRAGEARANPYTGADALTRVYAPTPPPRPVDGASVGGQGRPGHGRRGRPAPDAAQRAAPHRLMPLGGTRVAQAAYAADALRFTQAIEESQRTAMKFEERRERAQLQRCAAECGRETAAVPPQTEQVAWREAPPLLVPSAKPPHEVLVAFDAESSVDGGDEHSDATTPVSPGQPRATPEASVDLVVDSMHEDVAAAPPKLFAELSEPPRPPAAAASDASAAPFPAEDVKLPSLAATTTAESVAPHDAAGLRQARQEEAFRWVAALLDSRPTASEEAQPHTPVCLEVASTSDAPAEELRAGRMSEAARLVAAITAEHRQRVADGARRGSATPALQPVAEAPAVLQSLHSARAPPSANERAELRALRGAAAADLVRSAVLSTSPPQPQPQPQPQPPLPRLTSGEEVAPHAVVDGRDAAACPAGATLHQLRTALARFIVTSLAFLPAMTPRASLSSASMYAATADEMASLAVTLPRPPEPLQAVADDHSARAAAAPQEPSMELHRLRRAVARELVASLGVADSAAIGLRAARFREAQLLVRSII